jgi:hypothetical protein
LLVDRNSLVGAIGQAVNMLGEDARRWLCLRFI